MKYLNLKINFTIVLIIRKVIIPVILALNVLFFDAHQMMNIITRNYLQRHNTVDFY